MNKNNRRAVPPNQPPFGKEYFTQLLKELEKKQAQRYNSFFVGMQIDLRQRLDKCEAEASYRDFGRHLDTIYGATIMEYECLKELDLAEFIHFLIEDFFGERKITEQEKLMLVVIRKFFPFVIDFEKSLRELLAEI